jgi:hypothetical protein
VEETLDPGDKSRLVGLKPTLGVFAVTGVIVALKVTVPEKPRKLVRTNVEAPEEPLWSVSEGELAERVNSADAENPEEEELPK